ncbi:hypothetical protein BT93_K0853 [Corymbia citriodora subsp. variegata]|nr:hypothetical protein BT93_K0853 [Corymbia citriodora subsp. variegata]
MEEVGTTRFDILGSAVRKKRTRAARRPRPDSYEGHDLSPLSSAPASDDASKVSSDDNIGGDTNSRRKEFNLNQCVIRVSSGAGDSEKLQKKVRRDDEAFDTFYNNEPGRSGFSNKRSSEGVLAPANWKSTSKAPDNYGGRNGESQGPGQSAMTIDGVGNENKVKKVKLKVGGVTHTISTSNGTHESGSFVKSSRALDSLKPRQRPNFEQGNLDGTSSMDKRTGLQGIPWKDFSKGGFSFGKEDSLMGKMSGRNPSGKQGDKSEPVRKSKRVPKKRLMDGEFNDDEDDELRYLEKLKTSKIGGVYREDDEGSSKKQRKLASVSDIERLGAFKGSKDGKKLRTDRISDDTDYEEEDETGSDGELQGRKKKRQKKESVDTLMDNNRKEMTLTTRQRALQSSKDASVAAGSIEYPNGLPPAPPRKQKEKLSEVEQQVKKAEAAQRRRMQNEKAARESEAEAIRKILGQDSSRKKREDKMKKRREELREEKAANESIRASNCIRWVMGPAGTVVTFPNEMGLPSIFDSKSKSYPPPRETCVGPLCNNPYKYRDSKTRLPLCSLQCYQAVQEKMLTGAIC